MMPLSKIGSFHYTLRFSIGSAFVFIVVLTSAALGLATYRSVRSFIRKGITEELRGAAGIAALAVDAQIHARIGRDAEQPDDYDSIRRRLRELRDRCRNVRFIYTIRQNANGEIVFVVDADEDATSPSQTGDIYDSPSPAMLASFSQPYGVHVEDRFYSDQWGTSISGYAPILLDAGRLEAVLGMDISAEDVIGYERRHLLLIAETCLLVAIVVGTLAIFFARSISRPLVLLENDMSRIQKFDLSRESNIVSHITEVISMRNAVENMKTGLRSFRKYVPADLVSELVSIGKEAELGAEKREITVFFSDITDFASISERLSLDQLADNLAVYFRGMTEAILQHGGTVDKYIGDAIMAFWGAPRRQDDQAARACKAALRCRQLVENLSDDWSKRNMLPFKTRIGVDTGEAIVGNIGYEERLNYTAVGDHVNLASRLEGLNKYYGTSIIISESTYRQAREQVEARLIDMVAVKGKTRAVKIYELLAEKGEMDAQQRQFLDMFQTGMNFYLERSFQAAADLFSRARYIKVGDVPSEILLGRCLQYRQNPPPADWAGVFSAQDK